jgi:hypothetical protein
MQNTNAGEGIYMTVMLHTLCRKTKYDVMLVNAMQGRSREVMLCVVRRKAKSTPEMQMSWEKQMVVIGCIEPVARSFCGFGGSHVYRHLMNHGIVICEPRNEAGRVHGSAIICA